MFGADGVINFCGEKRRRRLEKFEKCFPEGGEGWSGGKVERGKSR